MPIKNPKTVSDFLFQAGGTVRVASIFTPPLNQYTVERWQKIGIPRKYWSELMKVFPVTLEELFSMSEKITSRKKRAA